MLKVAVFCHTLQNSTEEISRTFNFCNRATASQPIIDMSRGTLGEGAFVVVYMIEGIVIYFVSASAVFRGSSRN